MKILHILPNLKMGGAEKLVVDLAEKLNLIDDIKCDILVLDGGETPLKSSAIERGVKVHSLNANNIYNPLLIFKIRKYWMNYDILHVHLFPTLYIFAIASIFLQKRNKMIFTEHNTENRRMKLPGFTILERIVYQRYQKIICISTEIYSIFKSYLKLPAKNFAVVENGVDINKIFNFNSTQKQKIMTDLNIDLNDVILLQVSAFRNQKDQQTVIKSLKLLNDNVKVIFLGDGPNRRACEKLTRDLGLANRVHFCGVKKNVFDYFGIAKIVLLSTHYEGLSLASIEGMASGKPFIASNVPGVTDIVKGAGILVPESDPVALSIEINKLISNEKYYKSVVSLCMKRAEKYDIAKTVTKHIQLYKSLYV